MFIIIASRVDDISNRPTRSRAKPVPFTAPRQVLRDRTRYGSTRISPKSYFVHHTQRITKAAVMFDAKAILKQVVVLKQRCLRTGTATHAATAGGGA